MPVTTDEWKNLLSWLIPAAIAMIPLLDWIRRTYSSRFKDKKVVQEAGKLHADKDLTLAKAAEQMVQTATSLSKNLVTQVDALTQANQEKDEKLAIYQETLTSSTYKIDVQENEIKLLTQKMLDKDAVIAKQQQEKVLSEKETKLLIDELATAKSEYAALRRQTDVYRNSAASRDEENKKYREAVSWALAHLRDIRRLTPVFFKGICVPDEDTENLWVMSGDLNDDRCDDTQDTFARGADEDTLGLDQNSRR